MSKPQGCSFLFCALCGDQHLVSDAVACQHPDAPPHFVCDRCSAETEQFEVEQMLVDAWRDARMSDNYFCGDCGVVTQDGSGWCKACARYDQVFEG